MNILKPNWPMSSRIKAFTTLRSSTFSLREKGGLIDCLPDEPIWLSQIHSAKSIEALPHHRGKKADATYTRKPNRICVIETADCLPILFCNRAGTEIAAVHGGWRGLAAGILKETLGLLKTPREELLVWLGPAIGSRKYEVGLEVFESFTDQSSRYENAFFALGKQKWLANLYEIARIELKSAGISQIYGGQFCTYSQADLFYSYRREKTNPGRMLSLIWIENE